MRKKIIISVIALFFTVVIFTGGFLIGFNLSDVQDWFYSIKNSISGQKTAETPSETLVFDVNTGLQAIDDAINSISASAINKKTKQELITAAIEGMIASLDDKYADYFTREEYTRIIDSFSGTMSGIGIIVTTDDQGRVIVVNPIEGTPAEQEGVLKDDIITHVDGKDLSGLGLDEVVAMIKGEEGTAVNITVFRSSENKSIDFTIERKRFYIPNFYTTKIEDEILYIQYVDFQDKGAENLKKELEKQIDGQIKGLIIDLRNNLGGTLNDAVAFSDLFLESGMIVTVRGRSNNTDSLEEFAATSGGYTEIPIIVLINGYSASAAELAAGALRDLGRATTVGEKSFGKGTVQIVDELTDGSGIKFTIAKYYLPSGVTIDGTGITPDIFVELKPEDTEDLQLNRAIEELKKMIENGS